MTGVAADVLAGKQTVSGALRNIHHNSIVAESHNRLELDTPDVMTTRVTQLHADLRELATVKADHEKLSLALNYAKEAADNVNDPSLAERLERLTDSLKPAIAEARAKEPVRRIEFGSGGSASAHGDYPTGGVDAGFDGSRHIGTSGSAERIFGTDGSNAHPNVGSFAETSHIGNGTGPVGVSYDDLF